SLRCFGGREALLAALEGGLRELGVQASPATAATACAALWRARGGGVPFHELPVSVIGGDAAFFRQIGISTMRQLLALPRAGLAQRRDFRGRRRRGGGLGAAGGAAAGAARARRRLRRHALSRPPARARLAARRAGRMGPARVRAARAAARVAARKAHLH